MRRYEYTTSSAVNGLPSWKVTPGRRWKVQRELIGADVPRLGERRLHLEVGVGLDERVEDVLEHLEREVGAGLVGVELVGFTGDRGDEIAR